MIIFFFSYSGVMLRGSGIWKAYDCLVFFFPIVELCCVDLESSGICENPSRMMPMIKWNLMFPSAKMETVMTGAVRLKKKNLSVERVLVRQLTENQKV